jgi:hypothetical protein
MIWFNPVAFACLAFIPVILLLHALRYRRRDVRVSTLFLWESVAREVQGSLGLQRLVQNLPLLLQLLLVALLTFVLANPALLSEVAQSKDIVLVLDTSASMQTRTPQGTRFAQAQQHALDLVRDLPSGRQMAVIAAGRQPQVASFFTAEKALLRQAIRDLHVSDASGNMREAIFLALSFTQGSKTHEVVIVGDGAYHLRDLELPRSQIRHIQVPGGERNVGITRLAFRKVLEQTETYEVLVAVKNFSPQPVTTSLQLGVPRRRLLERQLQLQPDQEEVLVAPVDGPLRGVAQAALDLEDDFPLDNRAYGMVTTPAQTWVLLVGAHNFFLETLLTSIPGVLVNTAPQVDAETLPRLLEANRLIIFNGVPPPPLRQGNFLLINTVPPDPRIVQQGTVLQPQVVDWQRQHPLLQFVDLTDLRIEEALTLKLHQGAQSLVDTQDASLLSIIDEPPLHLVTLGFDLMRSDLPLRVAFPVFISNLLRWINPQQDDEVAGHVQAGTPYPVFFDPPVSQVSVQDPQGKMRDYPVQGNPWIFADTHQVGVYIFRAGESKHYLTVNLLDDAESDINPADKLPSLTPGTAEGGLQQAGTVQTPLWVALLLGAVVVVFGEWYAWCRDF